MAYGLSGKVQFFSSLRLSLDQNVAHSFDVLVSVISSISSLVSASVGVAVSSSSTKPNSGVTSCTAVFVITKDTDSCFAMPRSLLSDIQLNPSLLQLGCSEPDDPISDFHVLRPSEVAR